MTEDSGAFKTNPCPFVPNSSVHVGPGGVAAKPQRQEKCAGMSPAA
jgi:hypothetical protein